MKQKLIITEQENGWTLENVKTGKKWVFLTLFKLGTFVKGYKDTNETKSLTV